MTQVFGYMGKNLYVDLTSGRTEVRAIDIKATKRFVGGMGMALWLAYDSLKPGLDPLSPSNVLAVGAGPLAGAFPLATRLSLVTKEPMTGAVAFNNCGMMLGRRIKAAGYDNLVVSGKADRPVYLKIFDDDVELLEASNLWGKNLWETTEELWNIHGPEHSVIAIGQAGENIATLAITFVDNLSHLGKGGLGAVMGSKNLKAIVVGGSKRVAVFDRDRLKELTASHMTNIRRNNYLHPSHVELVHQYAEYFVDYWTRLWRNRSEVYPPKMHMEGPMGTLTWRRKVSENKIAHTRLGCPGCPVPCKSRYEVKEGRHKGVVLSVNGAGAYKGSPGPGKTGEINVRCANDADVEDVIYLLDLCNRYGVCIQAFAPSMDLAVDLYERGIIGKNDTGGIDLKRDVVTTLKLIEQVAYRKGFGNLLADGTAGLIRRFPKGAEYAMDIKCIDTQFDPRCMGLDAAKFGELTNPEGGAIEPAMSSKELYTYNDVKSYCEKVSVPDKTTEKILEDPVNNLSRITPYAENFHAMLSALDLCESYKSFFNFASFAELYTAVTGFETTASDLRGAADRIWNLYRAINSREGFGRSDDRPPARWFEPYKTETGEMIPLVNAPMGGAKPEVLTHDDLERLLDAYYDERGWDLKTGIPSKGKLSSLGLQFVADDLQKMGLFS